MNGMLMSPKSQIWAQRSWSHGPCCPYDDWSKTPSYRKDFRRITKRREKQRVREMITKELSNQ